ncbi:hypothetical protein DRQ00_09265 [candidate division KSB1 bacterium]|nr:MAG: hypothetical protein DRQ00_09265 [candidate division KSB1 bacterium]
MMKSKLLFLLICLFISSRINVFSQNFEQNTSKAQLNQLSKANANRLEIITYIERRGEINNSFGASVAGIGDNNLDGYDDVIIGSGHKGAGEALIFFGGAEMDSIPDIILHGENDGDGFGYEVASGGDINGDGDPDFIVAALDYPQRKGKGRVYVYFGGALLDTIPDAIFTGEYKYDNLGLRITAGDLNNDGCDDILIATVNYTISKPVRGKAYLYFGGEMLDSIPDWTNEGDAYRTYLGSGLAIGDLNGDGYNDMLISSTPMDSLENEITVTELFFGSSELDTIPELVVIDSLWGDGTERILFTEDFNLDGFDDFIIRMGARFNIYYGSSEIDTTPDAYLSPWYGAGVCRLASAGDVNGDGYPDVLAGAPHPLFQTGSVGLYLGSKNINPEVDWIAGGGGYFGTAIDGAGDVNGDGYDDIIFSTISLPLTHLARGSVWIMAGKPDLDDIGSGVEETERPGVPQRFTLSQNYPNPFNNQTTIHYQLGSRFRTHVVLTIYDITGKEVITLVDAWQKPGGYEVKWTGKSRDGKEVSSGVYLCRLSVRQSHQIKKLILMR